MLNSLTHDSLLGNTCYISRIKKHGENIEYQPFSTFHSIVYKILRITTIGNNRSHLHNMLIGSSMKNLVKIALTQIFQVPPTDQSVDTYYIALRQHYNGTSVLSTMPSGQQFLKTYEKIKSNGLDWEETLQLATSYLENNHVDQLKDFNYKNLILLNYEILKQPRNKNAYLFFKALCKWNQKTNHYNIYVKQDNKLKRVRIKSIKA